MAIRRSNAQSRRARSWDGRRQSPAQRAVGLCRLGGEVPGRQSFGQAVAVRGRARLRGQVRLAAARRVLDKTSLRAAAPRRRALQVCGRHCADPAEAAAVVRSVLRAGRLWRQTAWARAGLQPRVPPQPSALVVEVLRSRAPRSSPARWSPRFPQGRAAARRLQGPAARSRAAWRSAGVDLQLRGRRIPRAAVQRSGGRGRARAGARQARFATN